MEGRRHGRVAVGDERELQPGPAGVAQQHVPVAVEGDLHLEQADVEVARLGQAGRLDVGEEGVHRSSGRATWDGQPRDQLGRRDAGGVAEVGLADRPGELVPALVGPGEQGAVGERQLVVGADVERADGRPPGDDDHLGPARRRPRRAPSASPGSRSCGRRGRWGRGRTRAPRRPSRRGPTAAPARPPSRRRRGRAARDRRPGSGRPSSAPAPRRGRPRTASGRRPSSGAPASRGRAAAGRGRGRRARARRRAARAAGRGPRRRAAPGSSPAARPGSAAARSPWRSGPGRAGSSGSPSPGPPARAAAAPRRRSAAAPSR